MSANDLIYRYAVQDDNIQGVGTYRIAVAGWMSGEVDIKIAQRDFYGSILGAVAYGGMGEIISLFSYTSYCKITRLRAEES